MDAKAINCKRRSVLYDGSFPLDFLRRDECVRSGDPESGSCEILSPRFGALGVRLGEIVERTETGGVAIRQDHYPSGCVRCGREVSA